MAGPNETILAAIQPSPPITTFLRPGNQVKYAARNYLDPATQQWIPCVEEVIQRLIENQQVLMAQFVSLSAALEEIAGGLGLVIATLPGPPKYLVISISEEDSMPAYLLPDDGTPAVARATAKDSAKQPTIDPNALTWSAVDPTIVTVTGQADGTATLIAATPVKLGTTQVSVTDGTITGTADVQVVGGPVAELDISIAAT